MSFQNGYNPGTSGVNHALQTMGVEDDIFHDGADYTQWKFQWSKYTYHHQTLLIQNLMNVGLGQTMTGNLIKTPDHLFTSYITSFFPALDHPTEKNISWVNAPGLRAIERFLIKVGSQVIFEIDGQAILMHAELTGKDKEIAKSVGLCRTTSQLVAQSKLNKNYFAPLIGLPFHDNPALVFSLSGVAFHGITVELRATQLGSMIRNFANLKSYKGAIPYPLEKFTKNVLQANSVKFALATNVVWIPPNERTEILHGKGAEKLYRELSIAGKHNIAPNASSQRLQFEINIKGPCTCIAVNIRSKADIDSGNWTKRCDNKGLDYIDEFMLLTGNTAREDGMPADFYRTCKVLESFKSAIDVFTYILAFETNAQVNQMTGHQNMTNIEKILLSALYRPHDQELEVIVYKYVYNGWYHEKGTCGNIWEKGTFS